MSILKRLSTVLISVFVCGAAAGIALAQVSPASTANVTIAAGSPIRTVDPRIFGVNTATWDPALDSSATLTLLAPTKVGVFRFPGGSTSDTYHWQTNTAINTSTGQPYQSTVSFDQFAAIAVPLGAQAFITTNYGSGTAQEAAAWVQYSNVTKGYGFKYWEIGNECYGGWEYDTHAIQQDPYTYALMVQAYMTAMKAIDPTIKVGIVVETGEDSYANNQNHPATNPVTGVVHYGWTPVLLTTLVSLGVMPDFAIYHRYEQAPGQENDAALLQAAATWKDDAANLRMMLNDYMGQSGAGVELVCTENNSVYTNPGKQSTSIVNGLYLADSTGQILQTEFNSLVWWDLRNGQQTNDNNSSSLYGWRKYGDYGIVSPANDPYPTYYIKKLLSHFASGGEQLVTASTDNTLLAAFATIGTDGVLRLLVLNKDPSSSTNANIQISGFSPSGGATLFSYGIPQDNAAKTGTGSPDVAQTALATVSSSFTYTFSPYSATVLLLAPGGTTAAPAISSATFDGHKTLIVLGSGFGPTPRVLVNNVDVSDQIKKASDGSIKVKGKAKILGLVTGANTVQVIGPGNTPSNVFTLTL